MENALLLETSTIFPNSNLIDNIHQSYIDLKKETCKDVIEDLLKEAITYLDKDIEADLANELFSLITLCFLKYPNDFLPIMNELFDKSKNNTNYIIITASILSSLTSKECTLSQDYSNFITETINEIQPQIQDINISNIFVFGHQIPPKFKYDLVIDILISSKLSEELLQKFLPFILTQKFYKQNPKFPSLFHQITKAGLIKTLSSFIVLDDDLFSQLSVEDLGCFIPFLPDQIFKHFFNQLYKMYLESDEITSTFIINLIEKCESLNIMNLDIDRAIEILLPSDLTKQICHYLKKDPFFVPEKFVEQFKKLNDTEEIINIPSSNICIHYTKDENEYPEFDESTFDEINNLYGKERLDELIDDFIFSNYPPSYEVASFVCDYILEFELVVLRPFFSLEHNSKLLKKFLDQKINPPHLLIELIDIKTAFHFIKNAENEQDPYHDQYYTLLYIFAYSFPLKNEEEEEEEENYDDYMLEKVTLLPLKNEPNEIFTKLMKDFKSKNINQLDKESLLFISSTALWVTKKVKYIDGLNEGNIIPFYSLVINTQDLKLDFDHLFQIEGIYELIHKGCLLLANNKSEFLINSINSILSIIDENENIRQKEFTKAVIDPLVDIFIENKFFGDKSYLLQIIFKLSNEQDQNFQFFKTKPLIIQRIIENLDCLDKMDKNLKLNSNVFDINEVTKIILYNLQNHPTEESQNKSPYQNLIFTINLLEKHFSNILKLEITNFDFILESACDAIETNKESVFTTICNFIADHNFETEFYETLKNNNKITPKIKSKFFQIIPIEERTVDQFIDALLSFSEPEKNDKFFEELLKKMISEKSAKMEYLKILIDRKCTFQPMKTREFIKLYYDEYLTYEDDFIEATDFRYFFHPNDKSFVQKVNCKLSEIPNSEFADELISKLFEIVNKTPEKYQVYYCLKSIACTVPFFFEKDPKRIFNSVLPVLDFKDDLNIENKKSIITASSFLLTALHSTKIIESFSDWIFNEIENFTNSQVSNFILFIVSVLKTKEIDKVFMISIMKNINIISNLFNRKFSDNNLSYLIYNIYLKYYNYSCEFVEIDELKNIESPYLHKFDNHSTILPYLLDHEFLKQLLNDKELDDFINSINKTRNFWFIDYNPVNKEIEVTDEIFNKFEKSYLRLIKVPPPFERFQSISINYFVKTVPAARYYIQRGMWIYDYIFYGKKFPLLLEHRLILIDVLIHVNEASDINDRHVLLIDKNDYCRPLVHHESLFKSISCSFDNRLNREEYNHFNELSILSNNDYFIKIFLDHASEFLENIEKEDEEKGFISLYAFDRILFELIKLSKSNFFIDNFFPLIGNRLIKLILQPQNRTNNIVMYHLALLLLSFEKNKLPISVTHFIAFMFQLNYDDNIIEKALQLCSKFELGKLSHLSIIQDTFDDEISKKNASPRMIYLFCTHFPSASIARKLEMLNLLCNFFEKYINEKVEQEVKNLEDAIISILNLLGPSRDSLDSFSMSESKTIKMSFQNQKFSFQPIPEFLWKMSPKFWEVFDKYRNYINQIAQKRKDAISNFKIFTEFPELFDFKIKLEYFKFKMNKKINGDEETKLLIDRNSILECSFNQFQEKEKNQKENENVWLNKLKIEYLNEKGLDLGGLTKDWFTNVLEELFDSKNNLFIEMEKTRNYQPYYFSGHNNADHLKYFNFTGKVLARCIIQGLCTNFHLTIPFIKQILHRNVCLNDFESVDGIKYNSLKSILDGSDFDDLYFEVTDPITNDTVELKENGSQIEVTNENKIEYINLITNYYLVHLIKDQIKAFSDGFDSIIPHKEIRLFSASEFDLLIGGVPEIDVNIIKENVNYESSLKKDDPSLVLFFNAISKWDNEKLAKLLLFFTGSSVIPVGGFKQNEKIIICDGGDRNNLPHASTCFNTLYLPKYENEDELNQKFMIALNEQNFYLV